ncbi:hypothetical protein V2J09_014939 [Rumex salicifolius]
MEEENTQTQHQNNAYNIMRTSIHTFLTHFHRFTSTPTLFALPFSLSLLLLRPSAASSTVHHRLHAILLAAGIPLNSPISQFFLFKLSQTLSSSLSSLPFTLSFLLLSKSATIQSLRHRQPYTAAFPALLLTQICNLFILLAANSACLSLLCLATAAIGTLPTWAYAAGAVFYSVVVANAVVVCNLALISSGWEGIGGFTAIVRAFILIRGKRTLTALALALPASLAMAGTEAMFRYRIFSGGERWIWGLAAEMVLIAFMYSVLIVGDTIVGCLFYQNCKEELGLCFSESEIEDDDDEEDYYPSDFNKLRALEEGFSS